MAELSSLTNMRLAWKRALSGQNPDYRELQRIEAQAFGWAEEENLIQLQAELHGGLFTANPATKLYVPKPSGLLRPITLLRIRDEIVYQAITNSIAARFRNRLKRYYYTSVYSNILTSSNYEYFYRRWQDGYRRLNQARENAFHSGQTWVGEMDLTSFYDTIDHTLLRQVLQSLGADGTSVSLLFDCLPVWTRHSSGLNLTHGHGVPQGPQPSSFLAECVLHLLDRQMSQPGTATYFRYADNITVMAINESQVRRRMGQIEIRCRELGLVPQIKRDVQKVDNVKDMGFDEPSEMRGEVGFPPSVNRGQNDALRKLFLGAFKGQRPDTRSTTTLTKLRYALFRMSPDQRLLGKVTRLLTLLPCLTDAVNFYLRKFGQNSKIRKQLLRYLHSEPVYDLVSAQCLETLYLTCTRGDFTELRKMCLKLLSTTYHPVLRAASARVLGRRKVGTSTLRRMLTKANDVFLHEHLMVAIANSLAYEDRESFLNDHLSDDEPHAAMTAAYLLTVDNLKLTSSPTSLNPWATPILTSRGLAKKRVLGDRIGSLLAQRYGLRMPPGFSFRTVFGNKRYKPALLQLNMAEGSFAVNRSLWVTHMDNFNQLLLHVAYRKVGISILWGDEFGSLSSLALRTHFPTVAVVFQRCHDARLSNPVPHAYSKLLQTFPRDIRPREQQKLYKELKSAYQEFVGRI